ncbi:MAG TPA: hypothetical protein VFW44_08680 [Bryobacteraceae bacterium]|nr:hypothetical protein [Bryobacteraceae bacterium]
MGRIATVLSWGLGIGVLALFSGLEAQSIPAGNIAWRHIGNSAMELALPSLATGPVDRVWYSADGASLYARTASGRVFSTNDFEQWQLVSDTKITPPAEQNFAAMTTPELGLKLANASGRLYGLGRNVYRSDDGGASWSNLTAYKGACILGTGLASVAASPADSDEVTVASSTGLWRSLDGGLSWTGLNEFLPNLPSGHLLGLPDGMRGVRLSLATSANEIEWAPGEKTAWKPTDSTEVRRDQDLKSALSLVLKHAITAIATAEDYIYAGDSEGRLWVSADAGVSWGAVSKIGDSGKVEAIWVDATDPRVAVAALNARAGSTTKPAFVLRTMNGGGFWDDITANLPDSASAHGVTADRPSGAVYVATDAGVFFTAADLGTAGRPTPWTSLAGKLPTAAATDVRLDARGNQLYAALDGYGVYTAIAPHRLRDARVVNAADYSDRATAPGALLSVLGAHVDSASSNDAKAPVLHASDSASDIQVPFSAKGTSVALALQAGAGPLQFQLALRSASPAIFVDPEGTPLIMDASSGIMLDSSKPARAGSRIQVLATGLGQVKPDWPTGLEAPLKDPPKVVAAVHAYLDGSPVEVTQATLSPGYVGFYSIEIQIPRIVNAGAAELYVEADGQQSNHVRLYVEQ